MEQKKTPAQQLNPPASIIHVQDISNQETLKMEERERERSCRSITAESLLRSQGEN